MAHVGPEDALVQTAESEAAVHAIVDIEFSDALQPPLAVFAADVSSLSGTRVMIHTLEDCNKCKTLKI